MNNEIAERLAVILRDMLIAYDIGDLAFYNHANLAMLAREALADWERAKHDLII